MSEEVEIALLKARLGELERETDDLRDKVAEITRNYNVGKGMLFGIIFILGAGGVAIGTGLKKLWGLE